MFELSATSCSPPFLRFSSSSPAEYSIERNRLSSRLMEKLEHLVENVLKNYFLYPFSSKSTVSSPTTIVHCGY